MPSGLTFNTALLERVTSGCTLIVPRVGPPSTPMETIPLAEESTAVALIDTASAVVGMPQSPEIATLCVTPDASAEPSFRESNTRHGVVVLNVVPPVCWPKPKAFDQLPT